MNIDIIKRPDIEKRDATCEYQNINLLNKDGEYKKNCKQVQMSDSMQREICHLLKLFVLYFKESNYYKFFYKYVTAFKNTNMKIIENIRCAIYTQYKHEKNILDDLTTGIFKETTADGCINIYTSTNIQNDAKNIFNALVTRYTITNMSYALPSLKISNDSKINNEYDIVTLYLKYSHVLDTIYKTKLFGTGNYKILDDYGTNTNYNIATKLYDYTKINNNLLEMLSFPISIDAYQLFNNCINDAVSFKIYIDAYESRIMLDNFLSNFFNETETLNIKSNESIKLGKYILETDINEKYNFTNTNSNFYDEKYMYEKRYDSQIKKFHNCMDYFNIYHYEANEKMQKHLLKLNKIVIENVRENISNLLTQIISNMYFYVRHSSTSYRALSVDDVKNNEIDNAKKYINHYVESYGKVKLIYDNFKEYMLTIDPENILNFQKYIHNSSEMLDIKFKFGYLILHQIIYDINIDKYKQFQRNKDYESLNNHYRTVLLPESKLFLNCFSTLDNYLNQHQSYNILCAYHIYKKYIDFASSDVISEEFPQNHAITLLLKMIEVTSFTYTSRIINDSKKLSEEDYEIIKKSLDMEKIRTKIIDSYDIYLTQTQNK